MLDSAQIAGALQSDMQKIKLDTTVDTAQIRTDIMKKMKAAAPVQNDWQNTGAGFQAYAQSASTNPIAQPFNPYIYQNQTMQNFSGYEYPQMQMPPATAYQSQMQCNYNWQQPNVQNAYQAQQTDTTLMEQAKYLTGGPSGAEAQG